jgi:dephospho-CoA kinase
MHAAALLQATNEAREAQADVVVHNDGSVAELEAEVLRLWQQRHLDSATHQ